MFEAAELSHKTNSLPEICGRSPPARPACEGPRTLNQGGFGGGPSARWKIHHRRGFTRSAGVRTCPGGVDRTKPVAIGALGLAGFGLCRRAGATASPVVFDRYEEIGGLLTFASLNSSWKNRWLDTPRADGRHGRGVPPEHRSRRDITIGQRCWANTTPFMGMGTTSYECGFMKTCRAPARVLPS